MLQGAVCVCAGLCSFRGRHNPIHVILKFARQSVILPHRHRSSNDDALDGIGFGAIVTRCWAAHLATIAIITGAFAAAFVAGHLRDLSTAAVLAGIRKTHVIRSALQKIKR